MFDTYLQIDKAMEGKSEEDIIDLLAAIYNFTHAHKQVAVTLLPWRRAVVIQRGEQQSQFLQKDIRECRWDVIRQAFAKLDLEAPNA